MQHTIESLRKFVDQFSRALDALVEGVALVARDEVAEFLSRYNEMVPECDQRLQHSAGLLERGLRDEALGYEADEPALLEAVTLLDLSARPNWPQWIEALRALGFPEPVMPKVEVAVELRDAQEQVVRLKPLLDQWRRSNLMNAPLAQRIAIVRQLRKQDPNNESWHECLKAHEKQRAMEIERDVKAAVAAVDETRLTSLAEEFKAQWLEPPPQRIVSAVTTALSAIRGTRIDKEIEQVATSLAAALDAKDLEAARTLRNRWDSLAEAKGAFDADDVNVARALPAVEWVERHDRLESLFSEVWQSLDARPESRKVRREWVRKLARMRDEVEDLTERLAADIDLEPVERLRARVTRVEEELKREEGGRRRLTYLGVGVGVSMVVGIAVTVMSVIQQQDAVAQTLVELDKRLQSIEGGRVAPEELPAITLPDSLRQEPVVAAKLRDIEVAASAETRRRQGFQEGIKALGDMIDALAKAPRAESLGDWPVPFVPATQALASLKDRKLAKTADEVTELEKAEKRLQNAANRFQRDADELLGGKLAALQQRLQRARERMRQSRPAAAQEVDGVGAELEALRKTAGEQAAPGAATPFAEHRRVSRLAAKQLEAAGAVAQAIESLKADVGELEKFEAAERRLDESLGEWNRYADNLRALGADFGNQATARDYGEAARDADLWSSIDAWNRFAAEVKPLADLSPDEARSIANQLQTLRDKAGKLKHVSAFVDSILPAVQKIGERDLEDVAQSLRTWCDREWLGEIQWVVRMSDGKLYYSLRHKPEIGDPSFRYQRQIKLDGDWPAPKVEVVSQGDSFTVEESPQRKLAESLEVKYLARIPDDAKGLALDDILSDMAEAVIGAADVDPCLRMVNLRKVISMGRANSLPFAGPKVTRLFGLLDDGNGQFPGLTAEEIGEFLDPQRSENNAYIKAKKHADRVLAQAGPVLSELKAEIANERRRLSAIQAAPLLCIGRLGRDLEGRVVVVPKAGTTLQPGELLVVHTGGALNVIGACNLEGKVTITGGGPLVAGLPVFIQRSKTSAKKGQDNTATSTKKDAS